MNTISSIKSLPHTFFESVPVSFSQTSFRSPAMKFSISKFGRNFKGAAGKALIIGVVVLVLAGMGYFLTRQGQGSALGTATTNVNQSFQVTARDKDGRSLNSNMTVNITTAQKVNSVLIQGKRYKAREGKQFLLINYEMDNPDRIVYYSNPTDLVRYLRSDGKKFAPTVHQGIVQIRPDSTKNSNLGFVIDANENNFMIEIGELEGQKQNVEIKF